MRSTADLYYDATRDIGTSFPSTSTLSLSLSLFLSLSYYSCTSCIGASRCEWCPFSFQCIQPGRTCTTIESTVVNGNVCPQIFPSSATGEYLIHVNYDYQQTPLRINSSNLTQFRANFEDNRFTWDMNYVGLFCNRYTVDFVLTILEIFCGWFVMTNKIFQANHASISLGSTL